MGPRAPSCQAWLHSAMPRHAGNTASVVEERGLDRAGRGVNSRVFQRFVVASFTGDVGLGKWQSYADLRGRKSSSLIPERICFSL